MATCTVPTGATASVSFWLQSLVSVDAPIMMMGPAGTGKTQQVIGLTGALDPHERSATTVNFNFYTDSSVLQVCLELPLEKKTGVNFGPPGKTKLIYFLDDLNLPLVDPYDTQSAIALLRQHMEYQHFYDKTKLTQKNVHNTSVICCLNPTAGSFIVNPRLQRLFTTFAIGMPDTTSLLTIYETFLMGHFHTLEWGPSFDEIAVTLIKGALALHAQVSASFRKTAKNFHYEFNIRHISNVFQGLLVAQPEQFQDAEKFVCLWVHES